MAGHSGRCFRAFRRTKKRYTAQGRPNDWSRPIRQKVPRALRAFVNASASNQKRVSGTEMKLAIIRSMQHQARVGHHAARGR